MSYVVLARKWRPMRFEDLVGQEHVSRTLQNAIAAGRVAHAYLFTGVRGVGKTTAARILAKALNCLGGPDSPHTGPTPTPCLECAACREITAGTDVDVREIDGASYNGVDEVRKLQDSLPYRPARDRSKIFIIDEVHMLSQSAWNAFLKTLEEPPPHVKFIFATTEVHKVPVTILSRVQRFDFKLIPTQLIAQRLRHVLDQEGIQSDDAAIAILAREAAGSMRDAMSLLDQVIAGTGDRLDGDHVARTLGVASRQVLHDAVHAVVSGDGARALQIVGQLSNQGYDIPTVARDLLALLRDVVVAKVCKDPGDLLDLADEEKRDVQGLAAKSEVDDLLRLHQGFSKSFDDVVKSGQPRAALEMLLVRLSFRPPLLPIDDLVARLGAVERRLGGAPARKPPSAAPSPDPRSSEAAASAAPRRAQGREVRSTPSERKAPSDRREDPPSAPASTPAGSPPAAPSEVSNAPARSSPRAVQHSPQNGHLLEKWAAIVDVVRKQRPDLAAILQHATPISVDPEHVVLGFEPGSVFERSLRANDSMRMLESCAAECLGARPMVRLEARAPGSGDVTMASAAERERQGRQKELVNRAKAHPRIAEVTEIFGARLKEVVLPDE